MPASTPLHDAADSGDVPTVTGLLQNGADANARAECPGYDNGATPLHLAARGGHLPAVLALLGAGATPHGRDADSPGDDETGHKEEGEGDLTPLHEACARGHVAVVKALLDAGERTDWIAAGRTVEFNDSLMAFSGTRDGGHTPLHLAAAHGHVEVVRALIDTGAPVNIQVDCDDTPLHLAAAGGHVDVMAALLDAGADVDAGDHVGNTALHAVGDVASLEFLLAAGANPNLVAASKYGSGTPLGSYCTLIHRLETNEKDMDNATAQVEVLLRHGADTSIHASNAFPRAISPILSCAAKNGVPGIVSALLSAGLDPNERDKQGWTSLHDAAQGDHLDALRLLLRAGADVNAPTDRGKWTPLHLACRYTSPDCVLELLRWGADPDARTGVDSDDDAWRSDVVFGEGRTGVSRGCGKVPSEVIGLKNYAAPPAIGGTGPAADPSLDEDEQMEVFDGERRKIKHASNCTASEGPRDLPFERRKRNTQTRTRTRTHTHTRVASLWGYFVR